MTIYKCANKRCRAYRVEFAAMDVTDALRATGRRVACKSCFQVAAFVRPVESPKV